MQAIHSRFQPNFRGPSGKGGVFKQANQNAQEFYTNTRTHARFNETKLRKWLQEKIEIIKRIINL